MEELKWIGVCPRALHCREKCYVRFINNTERVVEVLWIDFVGHFVQYGKMNKGAFIDINTYKSHPFIALDFRTKDRLKISGEFYYFPMTSKEIAKKRFPNVELPENHEVRVRAYITLPVYSLSYACLLALRNCLQKEIDVNVLQLPKTLSESLKKVISQRNKETDND